MSEKLPIFNNPVVQELWAGIGVHKAFKKGRWSAQRRTFSVLKGTA